MGRDCRRHLFETKRFVLYRSSAMSFLLHAIEFGVPLFTLILVVFYIIYPSPNYFIIILSLWCAIIFTLILCVVDHKYNIKSKYIGLRGRFRRYHLLKEINIRRLNSYHPDIEGQVHNCSICLEDIVFDKEVTKCLHVFHRKCLDLWQEEGLRVNSCPYCRFERYRSKYK